MLKLLNSRVFFKKNKLLFQAAYFVVETYSRMPFTYHLTTFTRSTATPLSVTMRTI